MQYASIKHIEYVLGEQEVSNESLINENPSWDLKNISFKTGIKKRYIVKLQQCASDLAVKAAEKLFTNSKFDKSKIDFILFCTQTADYFLPATACLIQDRLSIHTNCGAFDYSIGCSGFIYGLGIAKGLLETNQAENILLITGDTYSRFIHPKDKSTRVLFSDAATAILLTKEAICESIGPFSYFTEGKGANSLIVPHGAMRNPTNCQSKIEQVDRFGNVRSNMNLYMNGIEITTFSLTSVPIIVKQFLERIKLSFDDIDYFVFHQANRYILERLRERMEIPMNKFHLSSGHIGNTVASSIPIALKNMQIEHLLNPGKKILLLGFGVGYSIGAALVKWV